MCIRASTELTQLTKVLLSVLSVRGRPVFQKHEGFCQFCQLVMGAFWGIHGKESFSIKRAGVALTQLTEVADG